MGGIVLRSCSGLPVSYALPVEAVSVVYPSTSTRDSAVAYQDAQRRWDNSLEELNMVLDSVARTVDDANARMSQINTSAANSWA